MTETRTAAPAPGPAAPAAAPKRRVLLLCTHNSARSQMAEGWLRHYAAGAFDVVSAGTEPRPAVHPLAVRVMADAGVDLAGQRPKSLAPFVGQRFDFVITVCDRARDACPTFPDDPVKIHWTFADPAAAEGTEAERTEVFRRTRDAIQHRVRLFVNVQVRPGA
jgi:thioredoxin type arsenate reductase